MRRCSLIEFTVEGSAPFPFPLMAVERASFRDPGELGMIHVVELFEVSRPGKRKPEMKPKNRRITLVKVTVHPGGGKALDLKSTMPDVRLWAEAGYRVDRGSIKGL